MIIKDSGGKYVLKADKQRRIVYEVNTGSWDAEDYLRYCNEYKNKIMPYLGKGKWAKQLDMINNMPNTKVTPELIGEHAKWIIENDCTAAALVVNSATFKMQLNRSVRNTTLEMHYFDNEKDANEWLKSKGF